MKHMIEVFHSRFGAIKLLVERAITQHNNEEYSYLRFYYPDDSWMGEWDSSMGGGLGWPTLELKAAHPSREDNMLDKDERSYLELENILLLATKDKFRAHYQVAVDCGDWTVEDLDKPRWVPPYYNQDEVDKVFGKSPFGFREDAEPGVDRSFAMGGSSFYINESHLDGKVADELMPREPNIHCCQMADGTILVFEEWIPNNVDDAKTETNPYGMNFNSEWIVALPPSGDDRWNRSRDAWKSGVWCGKEYWDAIVKIIKSNVKDGKLASN